MIQRLRTYSRFVKIEHSVFALPLVLAGVLVGAGGWPSSTLRGLPLKFSWPIQFFIIAMAAVGARTVAFALNRILDSKMDALNPRTSNRELPSGTMTRHEALGVGFVGAFIYFTAAFLLMNVLGLVIGIIPLLVFAVYPFLKRFTSLAHFGVGLSLALAPLAGWIAMAVLYSDKEPRLHQIPFLVVFTFLWVSGFDIIYSTMDEAFDKSHGLHSLPAKLGRKKALGVSAGLHAAAFVTLAVLYGSYFRTPVAGVLLGAAGVLLFLEQYLAENVDLAFFKINAILSFVVLAFIWTGVAHL